jgi:hypothetical protein
MKKYRVSLASPTVYDIEADDQQAAIKQAVELWKQERHTWIDPSIQEAEEIPTAAGDWSEPKVYTGDVEEEDEYLS